MRNTDLDVAGSQIIIFTNVHDPHADAMVRMLSTLGHEPIRLNTDALPYGAPMTLDLEKNQWTGGFRLTSNGRLVDVADIRSIWFRRPSIYQLPAELERHERAFAAAEMDHALGGLWASVDCFWMSRPSAIRQAEWKGEQLQRAGHFGFDVPRTLITTDPEAVRGFFDDCGGSIVFKTLSGPAALAGLVPSDTEPTRAQTVSMLTRMVHRDELDQLDAVRTAPCIFQEYVDKDVELRVTVIGDELFTAAIHSQEDPRTKVDFRRFDVDIPYRKFRLPAEVEQRCVEFVHSYGLTYSALDLILTPDQRFVFIENNPVGQFMFVERMVPELRMTKAVAAALIRGGTV